MHEGVIGERLLSDAVAYLGSADRGEPVAQHGDDAVGRRGVGRREAVPVVEPPHRHDLAVAHRIGGDVGVEQFRPRLEHLTHHAGLVAQPGYLERHLLQGRKLSRDALQTLRAVALRLVEVGVVERQRGELADRLDQTDVGGRVGARRLVVEELDHPDHAVAHLERHAELAGLAVLHQQAALVVAQRRIVATHDRDRVPGLDHTRRRRVVGQRPEPADDVSEVEAAVVVAHDRAHRVGPRLEHVNVAAAHAEQRDQALHDRLDHRVRLEARGEVEARLDDQ